MVYITTHLRYRLGMTCVVYFFRGFTWDQILLCLIWLMTTALCMNATCVSSSYPHAVRAASVDGFCEGGRVGATTTSTTSIATTAYTTTATTATTAAAVIASAAAAAAAATDSSSRSSAGVNVVRVSVPLEQGAIMSTASSSSSSSSSKNFDSSSGGGGGATTSYDEASLHEEIQELLSRKSPPTSSTAATTERLFGEETPARFLREHATYRETHARGGMPNDLSSDANLRFHRNELTSRPHGDLIDTIHAGWPGQYDMLEQHHGYIQWIFPLPTPGMNWDSYTLQQHEADAISGNKELQARVLRSYEMMLDFYGMRLVDRETGRVERSVKAQAHARYRNLCERFHNNLRITRILKSLGLLGLQRFQVPFLCHLIREMVWNGQLHPLASSLKHFFMHTVLNDNDRAALSAVLARH